MLLLFQSRSKTFTDFFFLLKNVDKGRRTMTLLKGQQHWAWSLIISWSCRLPEGALINGSLFRPRSLYIGSFLRAGAGRGGRRKMQAHSIPGHVLIRCQACKWETLSSGTLSSPWPSVANQASFWECLGGKAKETRLSNYWPRLRT